jgi:hypothetical protein
MRSKRELLLTMLGFSLIFLVTWCGAVMGQTIVDEVRAIRARDNKTNIDITNIALKFIPIGTPKDQAIRRLEAEGFKMYPLDQKYAKKGFDESLIGGRNLNDLTLFKSEIRIILRIKNGDVADISGRLLYHAL